MRSFSLSDLSIGIEAGGHGDGSGLPVLSLVSSILSAVPETGPPVLAAGGLVNGAHLAALLTLGASGAVFGTRFLLSQESLFSDAQRRALLAASSYASVRTSAFDVVCNWMGWPPGVNGRALRNSLCFFFNRSRGND
jgi:nitronate monooxygenase